MLTVFTGANRVLPDALVRRVGISLAAEDRPLIAVVPKQLTLLTERLLLDGLKLRGSFRIQVLSPARLCTRIFEEAGFPAGVRVDERGRVMLARRAIRQTEALSIYRNAERRCGFSEKCARQIEIFMQGGVSPDDLRACAAENSGTTRMKLNDLASILEEYLSLAEGRFQDGENELIAAAERADGAAFLKNTRFCFFGFDVMPPTLTRLIARIAAAAPAAEMFFALENDASARDYDAYLPAHRQLERLLTDCRAAGTAVERRTVSEENRTDEIGTLARELFAYPAQRVAEPVSRIRLVSAKDIREECRTAAAAARTLAMRGMRWNEMQVLCADMENYRQPLIDAFAQYDVPLFLDSSRPVSRMAVAECLLTALRLVEKGFRSEDVFTLMRTECMNVTDDEADRLTNYAIRRGVDGTRWLRPLVRGTEAEVEALEPVRKRLIAPVAALKERLKAAEDLRGQLSAVFAFLEDAGAYERCLMQQRAYEAQGMRETAGALSQAWNRIVGALDQMAALMDEKKLSLRELTQTLTESLEAAIVKPLPQSGDAVYAQSIGRMLMQRAKALFVLGLSDRSGAAQDGLLTAAQRNAVSEKTRAYLGPDDADAARWRRYYLKEALNMTDDALLLSAARTGADGAAQREGLEIGLAREIFPELKPMSDERTARLRLCAPGAAAECAARSISAQNAGKAVDPADSAAAAALQSVADRLPKAQDALRRIGNLLQKNAATGNLRPETARAVFGRLQTQSITRLEKFAQCPFAYFAQYGLKPEKNEPFELNRRDEGVFLHEAVNEFLRAHGRELNEMDCGDAEEKMDRIAVGLLENKVAGSPMEDSEAVRAESRKLRATACRCARVLTEQMHGSQFRTDSLERSFGREDGAAALRAGETVLEGRIDRVDAWQEGNSLRVIDYKLGGKGLDLAGVFHGLEMQLPVYLGSEMRRKNARSAGVYYFALEDGVVNTQATDPAAVEKERAKQFRMTGLLPADRELIEAQTPEPEKVFNARFTDSGSLYANVARAGDADFERIVRHAQKKAAEEIGQIRSGEVRVHPVNYGGREACKYCDYAAACLFDKKLDAGKVRRLPNLKWEEVLEKLALEDTGK